MADITSTHNERVKLAHMLQTQVKVRRREKKIVLEGVRLLDDALKRGLLPEFVFYLSGDVTIERRMYRLFRHLDRLGIPCFAVTEAVMKRASAVESPPGILGIFPLPELPVPETPSLVLVLDGMSNPGNLGSALRTAAAAGVDLVLLPNTVDPYNPKALRGGMGAHFRVPIRRMSWPDIALTYGHLLTYLADAGGDTPYYAVDWLRPSMIIIGSEAHGPRARARQIAGTTISIPMASEAESLNAAVAAGIILYEVRRQRTLSSQESASS